MAVTLLKGALKLMGPSLTQLGSLKRKPMGLELILHHFLETQAATMHIWL